MSQLIKRITKKGFTLVELMIVVAIIGILVAIAVPKFADLLLKARESSVKGVLGAVRSGCTIYYSDTEGVWPTDINGLTANARYISNAKVVNIPATSTSGTGHTRTVMGLNGAVADGTDALLAWDSTNGNLAVNCTHADSKGSTWSRW